MLSTAGLWYFIYLVSCLPIIDLFFLQICAKSGYMNCYGPKDSERLSCGVLAIRILRNGDLLVGAGDGTVACIRKSSDL